MPAALAILLVTTATAGASSFRKIQLTGEFWAEGVASGDLNNDGYVDIVYGPYWWQGPDFQTRHTYGDDAASFATLALDGRQVVVPGFKGAMSRANGYSDNFHTFTFDFNRDGWTDILVIGFPGEASRWFENPRGSGGRWQSHLAVERTDNESPAFADLNGDGRPEIVCSSDGFLGYATFDPEKPTQPWIWRKISPKGPWHRFTHGLGVGDVNSDKRLDIIEANGWWEQPASLDDHPLWTKHPSAYGAGGAQMYAYDVNGDGKVDVITALEAHGFGISWFEQSPGRGHDDWVQHVITGSKPEENSQRVTFSQPHAMWMGDMNGDGLADLVTGKRFWAHGPDGDPDPNAPAVLYWFELKQDHNRASYVAHLIDDDSGVGTQVIGGEFNGDRRVDVLVGNKKGLFLFLRQDCEVAP